mgnify:CR=1 FL=1
MQSKGTLGSIIAGVIAIFLVLVCLFYLSFTLVSSKQEAKAEQYALVAAGQQGKNSEQYTKAYKAYIDSISKQPVWLGYNYNEVQKWGVGLGLDLKGGMNVILQVSMPDMLRSMKNADADPAFDQALANTDSIIGGNHSSDYVGTFVDQYRKLNKEADFSVVFNSIVLMTDAIMQAHNHAVIPVINTLIGGIVKVIVNYILVGNPDIAITGAPVGTIACYAVITVLNLIAMRRVLRRNAPKLLPNLWKTTIAAVLMGGATWLAYWGLGRIGMGRAVACLGSIVVAVLVYVVLIIVLKVLTYEDCLLLPKGEKIAKILRVR